MAASDGYTIDLPGVGQVVSNVQGLVSNGGGVLGEFGSTVLDGASFAQIGSAVATANDSLQSQLTSVLGTSMQLFGQLNTNVQTAATGYSDMDQAVATAFGGGTSGDSGVCTASSAGTDLTGVDSLDSLAGTSGVDTATIPTQGTSASTVSQWWSGLSQDQKQELATDDPAQIGALDGVPASVRDYANRIQLQTLTQQTQAQVTDLQNTPDTGVYEDGGLASSMQRQSEIDAAQAKLGGLNQLQQSIGPNSGTFPSSDIPAGGIATDGSPQKYLLGVDTSGTGHVIVASNNPDAANNVVTVVPGVGTALDAGTMSRYTTDADQLVNSANQASGGAQTTSAVAWMNYNAPQSVPAALSSTPAVQAGPSLDSFQQGLYATHDPSSTPYTTVIGHSYGSTVVGNAATDPGGLTANNVVAIGSPGMDVSNASAFGNSTVYAARDSNDPIVWAEGFHSTDPVTPAFGATVFNAGDGPTGGFGVPAHSYYFDPSSPAMPNMGKIITGNGAQVTAPPAPSNDSSSSYYYMP